VHACASAAPKKRVCLYAPRLLNRMACAPAAVHEARPVVRAAAQQRERAVRHALEPQRLGGLRGAALDLEGRRQVGGAGGGVVSSGYFQIPRAQPRPCGEPRRMPAPRSRRSAWSGWVQSGRPERPGLEKGRQANARALAACKPRPSPGPAKQGNASCFRKGPDPPFPRPVLPSPAPLPLPPRSARPPPQPPAPAPPLLPPPRRCAWRPGPGLVRGGPRRGPAGGRG
jgi:hypothetical protein